MTEIYQNPKFIWIVYSLIGTMKRSSISRSIWKLIYYTTFRLNLLIIKTKKHLIFRKAWTHKHHFLAQRKKSVDGLILGPYSFTVNILHNFNDGYSGINDLVLEREFKKMYKKSYPPDLKLDFNSELKEAKKSF